MELNDLEVGIEESEPDDRNFDINLYLYDGEKLSEANDSEEYESDTNSFKSTVRGLQDLNYDNPETCNLEQILHRSAGENLKVNNS